MLKTLAKRLTPKPLWAALHRAKTEAERRAMWTAMARDLRGATEADQTALDESIAKGMAALKENIDGWQTPVAVRDLTVVQDGLLFRARGGTDDLYSLWGARESAIKDSLERLLQPGDVFVDAGANIGFFTVLAAKLVGPEGRIYAIEMMAATAKALRANATLNGLANVTVVERALSDVAGQTIRAAVPDTLWGQASIVRSHIGAAQDVETTTLDDILAGEILIRLMKMDVEGAEALAIRGGRNALMKVRTIIFERQRNAVADEEIERLLAEQAMTVRNLDGANGIASRT